MIYGTKQFKNGKRHGYLEFDTGKRIILTDKETDELEVKIRLWQYEALERYKHGKKQI